ncbi:hypothetical protein ROZALSC1DRAFT_29943, partial [Rozella allomycis CSF55]
MSNNFFESIPFDVHHKIKRHLKLRAILRIQQVARTLQLAYELDVIDFQQLKKRNMSIIFENDKYCSLITTKLGDFLGCLGEGQQVAFCSQAINSGNDSIAINIVQHGRIPETRLKEEILHLVIIQGQMEITKCLIGHFHTMFHAEEITCIYTVADIDVCIAFTLWLINNCGRKYITKIISIVISLGRHHEVLPVFLKDKRISLEEKYIKPFFHAARLQNYKAAK